MASPPFGAEPMTLWAVGRNAGRPSFRDRKRHVTDQRHYRCRSCRAPPLSPVRDRPNISGNDMTLFFNLHAPCSLYGYTP